MSNKEFNKHTRAFSKKLSTLNTVQLMAYKIKLQEKEIPAYEDKNVEQLHQTLWNILEKTLNVRCTQELGDNYV